MCAFGRKMYMYFWNVPVYMLKENTECNNPLFVVNFITVNLLYFYVGL